MLKQSDPQIYELIEAEKQRRREGLEMIPSENHTSPAVLEALGSILTDKYSEGYPGKRYYGGNEFIDQVELICQERAKKLFNVEHANVQPYSGSPANHAVYLALCQPGDAVMGMHLAHGGHLTHGWKINFSGIYYQSSLYTLDEKTKRIDYDTVLKLAKGVKPKLIWAGATAYPRFFDWARFAEIAQKVGAILCADIAHYAGLVAGGAYPTPVGFAHVVTMTSHKTLRGPRGAMIMIPKDWEVKEAKDGKPVMASQLIDRAVFPGLQGGPHDHQTAAIAVALKEAAKPDFKKYAHQVVKNAKALGEELLKYSFNLVTGGTDNHLLLIDLTGKGVSGKEAEKALDLAGITVNKNTVPFDPRSPFDPSGIRLGTPALTTRGMKEGQMRQIAKWISEVVKNVGNEKVLRRIKQEVKEFGRDFPIPGL